MAVKLYSTSEAATQIGCHSATVRKYARLFGQAVGSRWAFSEQGIRQLRKKIRSGVGNPNFGPGYGLGRKRKKLAKKTVETH